MMNRLISRFRFGRAQREPQECLLYIHIPKTAGTSFRTELESFYGAKKVYPGSWYIRNKYSGRYPPLDQLSNDLAQLEIGRDVKVITGHYHFAHLRPVLPSMPRVTFLRDPVERGLSFLRHAQQRHKNHIGQSLEEIAGLRTNKPNLQISDLQTRYLCTRREDERRLDSAIENLDTFAVLGISERYRDSITLFNATFGTTLQGARMENVGAAPTAPVPGELIEFIEEHNPEDIQLYQAAVKKFDEQFREYSSNHDARNSE